MARKAYLASIVPVIVNAILNEHQIVVDIVAFVNKGDFPRSRLGEKQRGKILATWVTRKMRTMAQFGIRDADSALSDVTEVIEPRSGITSLKNGSIINSSLRNIEQAPQITEQRQLDNMQAMYSPASPPAGYVEMPAISYDDSLVGTTIADESSKSDDTPTSPKASNQHGLPDINIASIDDDTAANTMTSYLTAPTGGTFTTGSFMDYDPPSVPPPRVGPKPNMTSPSLVAEPLPAVEGREGDLWSLPSQRPGSGLKVQNASAEDEDEWPQEAIMHMNLASKAHTRDLSR